MKPARAAALASTGMASSRLPSTTSTCRASSGTLARSFSKCGGTKWIMRSSRTGKSRIGAPAPMRDLPVRLERMIHFVPPHLEKLRAKVPELARQVDVVLGNLEDAIPVEAKAAARAGFIEMAKALD